MCNYDPAPWGRNKQYVGLSGSRCAEASTGWCHVTPVQKLDPPDPESSSRATSKKGGAPSGDLGPGPQGKHCVTQTCVTQKETRGHFLGQCNFSSLPHCSCPLKPLAFIGPHLVLFPPHIHAPTHLWQNYTLPLSLCSVVLCFKARTGRKIHIEWRRLCNNTNQGTEWRELWLLTKSG